MVTIAALCLPALADGEIINTVAGGGPDGIPAVQANMDEPTALAISPDGELHIAVGWAHRVFKVDAAGNIHVVAGAGGNRDFGGDGGPAVEAKLYYPTGITFDPAGNLVIADTFNRRIRWVDKTTGIIQTIVSPMPGMGILTGVAYDGSGNLFIVDYDSDRIWKKDAITGNVEPFAGTGTSGFSGDGGPAVAAQLANPFHVAVDAAGVVYFTDSSNRRIRRVDLDGNIATEIQLGTPWAQPIGPAGIALSGGFLYFSDTPTDTVQRKDLATGTLTVLVSSGLSLDEFSGGLAVDGSGNLLVADGDNYRVVRVAAGLPLVAGNGLFQSSGDGLPAIQASLRYPGDVAFASDGDLLIAENSIPDASIRRVDSGTGIIGGINIPGNVDLLAVDASDNIYYTDCSNDRVRKLVWATGVVTTVAGNGNYGFSGDGGLATAARLACPYGVAVDPAGNLLITDSDNQRVRRVDAITGIITTVAGTGVEGFAGDNGPAVAAQLLFPFDLEVDSAGNYYFIDSEGLRIRKVDAATGIITTVAGNGSSGTAADGSLARLSPMSPGVIGLDGAGNIYVGEGRKIRRIDGLTNVLSTLAGSGQFGFSGDGGPALLAKLSGGDLAVGPGGNLFFADLENFRVRGVFAASGGSPVADAGVDLEAACASASGAEVTLDGSGSTDPDDDITLYEWFEGYGTGSQVLLGTGETLGVGLPLGTHLITLRVTDSAAHQDTDEVEVIVEDSLAPTLQVSVSPGRLWPPNGQLAPVHATVSASDACGAATVTLLSITSSDPGPEDDIHGAEIGTADFDVLLRAERDAKGPGRVYTLTYRAVDAAGNATSESATVLVLRDRSLSAQEPSPDQSRGGKRTLKH
jgi:DNA-binding beta-propeller fold protein YncE